MLEISLLGEVVIQRNGERLARLRGQTEIALLAYLAHSGQPHSREFLADLLWEAQSTKQSRSNLRTVLTRLRKQVGDYLLITRQTVAVTAAVHEQTDTVRLQAMLAGGQRAKGRTAVSQLRQALFLYRGQFMTGFSLPDGHRFNEWLLIERERLHQTVMQGYRQLAGWQEAQGAFAAGIITARQWVIWDPLDETAQQQLMRLLAYAGQTAEALAVYVQCQQLLQTELGASPAPATTALYRAIQTNSLPPPIITSSPPHNLPRPLAPLFGRHQETETVTRALLNPDYPFVAITGLGGIGKTSLALATGRRLLARPDHPFRDGIWFISLETIEDGSRERIRNEMALLVGQGMGLFFYGPDAPWRQLIHHLADKKLLLILDNVEQFLTPAIDLMLELLQAGDHIHLLTTSRMALPLTAGVNIQLAGLEIPASDSAATMDNECIRLFAERVARLPTPFQLEPHLAQVIRICQLVGGVPLSLELVAASLGQLMIDEVMDALTNNLRRLDTTEPHLPPRQRTFHAVFDYTWHLLTADEQQMLVQLSVFRGGFTRAAAKAILQQARPGLLSLQHYALLHRDETGRFRLHPLIRRLVAEKHRFRPEAAVTFPAGQARHSRYYLQMIGRQAPILQRGAPHQLLTKLQIEHHNIGAAWRCAVTQATWDDIEQSVDGILHYYYRSSLFSDGIELIRLALDAAAPPHLIPDLLRASAALLQPISQFEAALDAIQAALNQTAVSRETSIKTHIVWGLVCDSQGDYEASLAQYQTAVSLLQGSDDWLLWGRSQQGIGWALIQLGQVDAASQPLQQALAFSQQAADQFGQMMTLTFLGVQARRRHQLTTSEQYYWQALQLAWALGDRLTEGKLLANLGVVASTRFALNQAQRYAEQALLIFEALHVPRNQEITQGDLGVTYARRGNYSQAQHLLQQSLNLARQIEDRYGEAWGLIWLSQVMLAQGDTTQALQLGREALVIAGEINAVTLRSGSLLRIGDALRVSGALDEAADSYQAARGLCQQTDQVNESILLLAGLAVIAQQRQQLADAIHHVDTILTTIARQPHINQIVDLSVYWVCYQVLQTAADPRASGVLRDAHQLLLQRARNIDDPITRQQFLTQIKLHKHILDTAAAARL